MSIEEAAQQDYFTNALDNVADFEQFSLRGDYDENAVLRRIVEENATIRDLPAPMATS